MLDAEVAAKFPGQADGWRQLVQWVKTYDDVSLEARPVPAREVVGRYLTDPLLADMIFCPVMYYGSAQERDMEFGQFVIMFKALFLEGFARPLEGVRVIIRVLLDKYRQAGGERRMKCGVAKIVEQQGRAALLRLDDGSEVTADHVISSAGYPETMRLCEPAARPRPPPTLARCRFARRFQSTGNRPPPGAGATTRSSFSTTRRASSTRRRGNWSIRAAVSSASRITLTTRAAELDEGWFRVTCLANYDQWVALPEPEYQAAKQAKLAVMQRSARRFLPAVDDATLATNLVTTDMFTPRTVKKFTGHLNGAIYGAPHKVRDGRTHLSNLYLCGTDQGFLGIIGAMLSGISMANYHILQKSGA